MLIHVYYASLNFRDIMLATGKISMDKNRLDQAILYSHQLVNDI